MGLRWNGEEVFFGIFFYLQDLFLGSWDDWGIFLVQKHDS